MADGKAVYPVSLAGSFTWIGVTIETGRGIVTISISMSQQSSSLRQRAKKAFTFTIRWGIAVVGIWWVISQITWRDRVTVLDANLRPVEVRLDGIPPLDSTTFRLIDGREVARGDLVNKADQKNVTLRTATGTQKLDLLALDLTDDLRRVERMLVATAPGAPGQWVSPAQVVDYKLKVPRPLVEVGIGRMIQDASTGHRPLLLVLAFAIFPITLIVTCVRWQQLLRALEIYIPLGRTFVINMVGAFYNTFMPGVTGGDVLKAYYASKQTRHRTRAVISVLVDRVVGLLALIILGGTMALYQYLTSAPEDPAARACGQIALMSGLIICGTATFFFVFFHPVLRRYAGLEWLLARLPKQKQIGNALQTLEMYRKRPWLMLGALVMTFPVHITVVVSALLACKAFGLTLPALYYFVAVPVIVLVGSIPISPQGAGVMEYFAILMLSRQGGTVSQAFALTMSIRVVQSLWNLTGGIFVFRGGYHTPSEAERNELNEDVADLRAA